MGVICPLSPQVRALNNKNEELLLLIKSELADLSDYEFSKSVLLSLRKLEPRYKYSYGILQDIEKLHSISRSSLSYNTGRTSEDLEDQIKGSCLILQNQGEQLDNKQQKIESSESFCQNLEKNESLVEQINILYKKEIKYSQYSQALYVFLKWANMYQEHTYSGFLRPIYRQFYHEISKNPVTQIDNIVVEIQQFGQYMVSLITKIYGLKELAQSEGGRLIKNDNIYNLIMCYLFKRTKLKNFILECIRHRDHQHIDKFQKQLHRLAKKPISYFGVSSKFTLQNDCSFMTQSEKTKSTQANAFIVRYAESLKLVDHLSHNGGPITKLKTIIGISKQIIKEIGDYYDHRRREPPEMDPDNLNSIVMYLLVKNGRKEVYQQLKIVEYFTTSNCLNCISGFYLNTFLGAAESIIELDGE